MLKDETSLRVGLDYSGPIPLHTDFASEKFEGFEVDLMKEISNALGLTLVYKIFLWKDMFQKLENGDIDAVCTAVTVTNDRQQFADFTEPYLTFRMCLVSRKDKPIKSPEDVQEKNIGVRISTEAEKYVRNHLSNNNIILSDTNNELYQKAIDGTIDAVADDTPIAGAFVQRNSELKVSLILPHSKSNYAIAIRKGNTDLKKQIDKVLSELKHNGHYDVLFNRWFHGIKI